MAFIFLAKLYSIDNSVRGMTEIGILQQLGKGN
jgi:hypothetical protein